MCVCVQPWFPQQTQLSGPFDCVYVTVTLFQEHVLFERSDKEAQGSSQTRRRGCRVKGVKVRYPQSDTHLKRRATDREGQRAEVRERPKHVDLSLGAWRLSGEDRKDLRAEVKKAARFGPSSFESVMDGESANTELSETTSQTDTNNNQVWVLVLLFIILRVLL